MKHWKLQPKRNIIGRWYIRIVGGNGECVFSGQGYWSKGNCIKAVHRAVEELGLQIDWRHVMNTLEK